MHVPEIIYYWITRVPQNGTHLVLRKVLVELDNKAKSNKNDWKFFKTAARELAKISSDNERSPRMLFVQDSNHVPDCLED
jgi:hypothetical protein